VSLILANAYGPTHPKLDHSRIAQWTDQFKADGADNAIAQIIKHGIQGFSRAQLQATHTPVRVIWGSKDSVDSLSAGRQTAHDLHARLVVIPGAGHLTLLTNAAQVARAIESS
jgi:pimeloyl-ACP methyl ester carboxylesterase